MLEDINLNLYKVFYCVATLKSFKLASNKLCVSQPAISKQVRKLEDILGVKLFYRLNKGIELTKEGEIFFEHLDKANFYLEASMKSLILSKKLLKGELIIGCPSHITSFYLLDYIEKFRNDYPMIQIKIFNDSTSILIENLIHHKIDFIIDSIPAELFNNNLNIKCLEIFETAFIVNKLFKENINSIKDLDNKKFILPLPRSSMRKNLEKTLRTYNVNMNVDLALDTTDLIISSVKKNLGIGYVVKKSVENELKNGEIKELKIDCNLPKLELNLAYINDYLSPSARKFLKEYIKAI